MALTVYDPATPPRRVTILGSTGSVGRNTIDLIERHPQKYAVEALTANRNVELLAKQARRLRPKIAVIGDPSLHMALVESMAGTNIATAAGPTALIEAAERPAECINEVLQRGLKVKT